jgi:hypothetical protein
VYSKNLMSCSDADVSTLRVPSLSSVYSRPNRSFSALGKTYGSNDGLPTTERLPKEIQTKSFRIHNFFKEFLLVKRNGLPMTSEMLRENMIVGKVPRIQNITAVKLIF